MVTFFMLLNSIWVPFSWTEKHLRFWYFCCRHFMSSESERYEMMPCFEYRHMLGSKGEPVAKGKSSVLRGCFPYLCNWRSVPVNYIYWRQEHNWAKWWGRNRTLQRRMWPMYVVNKLMLIVYSAVLIKWLLTARKTDFSEYGNSLVSSPFIVRVTETSNSVLGMILTWLRKEFTGPYEVREW